MKYPPREQVRRRAWVAFFCLPAKSPWWAQVTVKPEARSTAVLRRGTEKGSIGEIPGGGQEQAIWGVGARAEWKKPQKKAKKNITSEEMKRSIPRRWAWTT